jgi:diguanylate cyclase (GGDEF)-like protein/PAS domain S-box-containing protein
MATTATVSAVLIPFIEQAPVAMALVGADGRYQLVNAAYARLLDRPAADLAGRDFSSNIDAPPHEALWGLHQRLITGGLTPSEEWEVRQADGQVCSVIAESVRVTTVDGPPLRLVHLVDISGHRELERDLQASQAFLESVLDGLSAQVCVLDDQGLILAVNKAWRQFGVDNSVSPTTVWEGMDYLSASEHASTDVDFAERLRDVLAGRTPHFQYDYPCHSPTTQRWFIARVSRIVGGTRARVVITHDDVSALLHAREALHRSEAQFLDLAASIPGVLFRLLMPPDGAAQFTYLSPGVKALLGIDVDQACRDAAALCACIAPEDRPGFDTALSLATASQGTWEHECRVRGADGVLTWVHARASARPLEGGGVEWTGMLMDVSERKTLEAGLKASEETYRTLFETVPQGVVYHDRQGRITSANPAAQRILGLTLEQLQGRTSIDPRWHAVREDGSPFPGDEHPAMLALRTGRPVQDVVMGVSVPDSGQVWILVNATPLFRHGELEQVYATFEDISARVTLSQELRLQASTDFLTGCANRRSLMERLTAEFERVRRYTGRVCSVLALDLDLFKQVNDRWGHAAGDAVLVHLAALMKQASRAADLVARSGGEEFMLLLPDTTADEARSLAERLRERIATTPLGHDGHDLQVTVSIGISAMSGADPGIDAVLARADRALYRAKAEGRNRVCIVLPPT